MQKKPARKRKTSVLNERASGILLPIFSLPSPHGVGTMGKAAFDFADFLHAAGQKIWQVLPLNPTGYGDSPYQPFSAFAGNPYFIDLDLLRKEGLLTEEEIAECDFGSDPRRVDYGRLYKTRLPLLRKAMARDGFRDRPDYAVFVEENADWLPDFALFTALKAHFGGKPWLEWEDRGARLRRAQTLNKYRRLLKNEIEFFEYTQYLFAKQWKKLKKYCNKLGISIVGDIPIYCALDSADAWANPAQFQLDENRRPKLVAGVPPDAFTEDGQLWGNPLYDWDAMKKDGYGWWIRRFRAAKRLYDVIRIDHFRGLESYWAVPAGDETARNGSWLPGPGTDFIRAVRKALPGLAMIAEDLGYITPEVAALLRDSRCPGMKVLEFAFQPGAKSNYVPFRHEKNCVCYIGTHDNSPILEWKNEFFEDDIEFMKKYLAFSEKEGLCYTMIRGGMESNANTFIAQMQDFLELGAGSRINSPGTNEGNWQWRMLEGEASEKLAAKIRDYTETYGRI